MLVKRKIRYSDYGFIGKGFENDSRTSFTVSSWFHMQITEPYTTSDVTLHNDLKSTVERTRNLIEKLGKVAHVLCGKNF